ncbi:hypothetical protein LCGC14_2868470 [marine sediment metagenome]|uniref:Uncharacterized protein n=1 Tax=marine sediment metagenome TaxID=412755 RepID=A0A0F8Y3V8_9ZZZZ
MSDYGSLLHLDVPRDLPADELWDTVEFVFMVGLLYGAPLDTDLFKDVDHPHIQRISAYVKEVLEERGVDDFPEEHLELRAKRLIKKLKTYCTVFLDDDENGPCRLIVRTIARP